MRPLPSLNGCMERKSTMNIGMSSSLSKLSASHALQKSCHINFSLHQGSEMQEPEQT